jgi:hypothetical protein
LIHEILLIRNPDKVIFITAKLPDFAETCPVRCYIEQPANANIILVEENSLAVRCNLH